MPDVISLLHRGFKLNPDLFDPIEVGNYRLSIQGSHFHHCSPRKDLPAYLYYEMEIAIYEDKPGRTVIPTEIMEKLRYKYEECGNFFSYVTVSELQWIYDIISKMR
jgi:hypothetical protein